ncbi:MAG: FAD-binding oxidoreductase, partial [Hyphomicrobiaceae bacterium]
AIGCSLAMHLARAGERDVVVLEKHAITHGSTWHAAGLVGQYRSAEDLTRLMQASVKVLDEIQAGTPIDWHPVGSLRIASSRARLDEYRAAAPIARRYGVGFEVVDAAEARRLFPLISTDGVHGAAFVPGDGYVDPTSLANAYASRARADGARLLEGVTVTGSKRRGDRVIAIVTDRGEINCETVVLATGVWGRPVGRMLGVDVAVAALEHQYAVTEKSNRIEPGLPALRDPDLNFYLKPEVGAVAIGGWEPATTPACTGDMPQSFGRELLPNQLDRLAPILKAATGRIPIVGELGLRTIINGPIPVTPDGEPILGPAPDAANVWLAAGFTSGIAASGGAGRVLSDWIVNGAPTFPVPSLSPTRFGKLACDLNALNARAIAAYAGYYGLGAAHQKSLA